MVIRTRLLAVASAIVLAPLGEATEPLPVVAWAHGTTGVVSGCAPTLVPAPFPFDPTLPALKQLIAANWVLVATDYIGLGTAGPHPYLMGGPEARSTLDAVRAARQLKELRLDPRTVVWGHRKAGTRRCGLASWLQTTRPTWRCRASRRWRRPRISAPWSTRRGTRRPARSWRPI